MIKKTKHRANLSDVEPQKKKLKKEQPTVNNEATLKSNKLEKQARKVTFKSGDKDVKKNDFKSKPGDKNVKKNDFKSKPGDKNVKKTDFKSKKGSNQTLEKPEDWGVFKKQKKELRIKRRENKSSYDVMVKAKKIGEKLRRKILQGGKEERTKLVNDLHAQLKGKGHYEKFVLTHDMARIIQYLLKFGSQDVRKEISEELLPIIVQMLESKYGKFCVKRMLKYGDSHIRSSIIRSTYGNAVKLASHTVSAIIFEYAYSTWATPMEKCHLIQEFFGDMYKQSKDDKIKHLQDVYKDSPNIKTAALRATKANLSRILNKNLYDSGLVQTVLYQFLSECSNEDRTEIISQISSHVVVLSNSRDGVKIVMNCLWHGTNKDRKIIVKSLKENIIDLCKHEHGHGSIITLLDCIDDTVLLNKAITAEILKHTKELSEDEWGRKVLLWLVAPSETVHFHPQFVKELEKGREVSSCKKSSDIRRKEILDFSSNKLLEAVSSEPSAWLSKGSIGVVTLAIVKSGTGNDLKNCLESLSGIIVDPEWIIQENETSMKGIEHPGLHMILKKLAQHDKVSSSKGENTFGEILLESLTDDKIVNWIQLNRGCFLLVAIYENGTEATQNRLKEILKDHIKLLKKQTTTGANILLKKYKE